MNELIKINYDNADRPTVLARDLHKELGVKEKYTDWFKRMCEYDFEEGKDYCSFLSESSFSEKSEKPKGGRPVNDHQITIPMEKELCMLQRTEKGKFWRQYFISVEEQWNSPDAIMARALQLSNAKLKQLETHCCQLETTVAVQEQQIAELQPKASYYDVVLNCKDLISIGKIAKDYGWSARKMNEYLHEHGVQYKQGKTWLLYQKHASYGYTSTKTHIYHGDDGTEHAAEPHMYWTQKGRLFIYSLLKADGIFPLIEQEEKTAADVA